MITPWSHQLQARDKVGQVGSIGLWMGMRTGKTTTSLLISDYYNLYPMLIISPLSVIHTWQDDYYKMHGTEDGFQIVENRNQLLYQKPRVFCTNYEKVEKLDPLGIRADGPSVKRKAPNHLNLSDFKSIYIDESYRIANWTNKITTYLLQWDIPANQFRFCLSGSPASEECYNMATQYLFMRGEFMGCRNIEQYLNKHWHYNDELFKHIIRDPRHIVDVRNHMHQYGYCITMEQLGLGTYTIPHRHRFDLNQKQISLIKHLQTCHIYTQKKTGEEAIMYPMTRVLFERKIAAGIDPFTDEVINTVKMDHVLQMYKDRPEPMLVVSDFTMPIKELYRMAQDAGIKCGLIYGDVKDTARNPERKRIREAFQAGEIDIVFAQPKTIYVGLDFSRVETIVFYANNYSQDVRSQLEQRGNATTRKTPYAVVDLLSRETVEEDVLDCLVVKKKNAKYYLKDFNKDIVMRRI